MGVVDFSADAWQACSPGLAQGLGRRMDVLDALGQGLEAFAGSESISGLGADAMRAYIREVHVPIIRSLSVAVSTFNTAVGVYWGGYADVDAGGNFRLVRDELGAHQAQLDAGLGQLRGFAADLRVIASEIAHVVSLGGAGAGAVDVTVTDFEGLYSLAKGQSETWVAYEGSDPGFVRVRDLIAKLVSTVNNVGSLTVGQGRSYESGTFNLTLQELGGLVTPMVEYCRDNQDIAAAGWESMFAGYVEDVEAAAVAAEQERREQAGWDLVWDALQITAGVLIVAVGVVGAPFSAGATLGFAVLGGSLIVGGVNSAINHVSIATTGTGLNLVGTAAAGAAQWYDVTVGQPARDSGSPGLAFLAGAGAAVVDMVGGALQLSVVDIGRSVSTLINDADARAVLWGEVVNTWDQVRSGDAYVIGQTTAEVASVLIPGAAAVKAARWSKLADLGASVKVSTPGNAVSALDGLRGAVGSVSARVRGIADDVKYVVGEARDTAGRVFNNLNDAVADAGSRLGGPQLVGAGSGASAFALARQAATGSGRTPEFPKNGNSGSGGGSRKQSGDFTPRLSPGDAFSAWLRGQLRTVDGLGACKVSCVWVS